MLILMLICNTHFQFSMLIWNNMFEPIALRQKVNFFASGHQLR
jgi:hypothetical protein